MAERLVEEYRPWKVGAGLFITLGSLALVVATIGVYSVLAYTLSQRTKELGVRMALGATASDMRRLVVVEGLRPVAIGAGVGIVLALVLGRLVASLLYGVSSRDPMTLVVSVAVLIGSGLLAGLLPAWRASRVDPVVALRSE
jgi:ABC-type antimicrobial peptide transport system permease subunit